MTASDLFDTAVCSETGLVRDHNEDAALSRPELGLWLVADGMGGHAAGDFASAAIVEAAGSVGVASSLDDLEARLLDRLDGAHDAVRARAAELGGTIGSTVVALLVHDGEWACAWAGDSRLYRLRGAALARLTRDHTEVEDLLSLGAITSAEATTWPRRNVITRAVGVTDEPLCDLARGRVAPGDVFLLCSDGLTEHVDDAAIAAHLARPDAEAACGALVEAALRGGGTDNVTCVVVRVRAAQAGAG